jgi:hypothetical protein
VWNIRQTAGIAQTATAITNKQIFKDFDRIWPLIVAKLEICHFGYFLMVKITSMADLFLNE